MSYGFPYSKCLSLTRVLSYAGHTRPLVNLSARLTKLQPDVYVTILTTNLFYDRAKAELARNFDSLDEEAAQRVRHVPMCPCRES